MSSNKENNNEINNSNQVLETAGRSSNVTSAAGGAGNHGAGRSSNVTSTAGGAGNRGVHNRIGVPTSTTKSFADLPDSIFCNIIEYLDWNDVGRFDNALLNRNARYSYLDALKISNVKIKRNRFLGITRREGILDWIIIRNARVISWLCADITKLMTITTECPQLKSLNIRGYCRKITDAGIKALATGCPQLQSLNISCCGNITDAGIRALASGL